jgi:predicted Zn-dependent peptidase
MIPMSKILVAVAAAALSLSSIASAKNFEASIDYRKLDNGLKVVLSEDHAVPTATIAVYYGIGFRIEPRDRTGFAHLFEHMMFQGSANLGKAEFINLVNSNGGILNGSTRFDFTNYFEVVPSNKTETLLWAEADRMRGLDITQENLTNQQGVVKNEVKVNVLNQPYGGFPWLDLPQLANTNWFNAHNFYGDLEDLDAATLEDVSAFFKQFYAPNNAVLVVAGDIDPDETFEWVKKYFGDIPPSSDLQFPDISEPKQTAEKRAEKVDALAPQPALGFAWHAPERGTPEWRAMTLLAIMLLQGDDSRLHQALVQKKGYASAIAGGVNWPLGNAFNYNGPMLLSGFLVHDQKFAASDIIGDIDAIVADLQTNLVSAEELSRARTKLKSGLYDILGDGNRIGLVDLLATAALFFDDPNLVNTIEAEFATVTPELIRQTARDYLRTTNRSVITLKPGAGARAAK